MAPRPSASARIIGPARLRARWGQKRDEPAEAGFDETLGEFLLPYAAVQASDDPAAMLMSFLQSTYEAAAKTGGWDRSSLECAFGRPGVLRPVHRD
ncbi:DUF5996 family protein [Limimaricola cinnabarinus]|uniref:DUF5996 family protein n=1 Tax=Limimaricola cinnabarinus TaxID=1125964 RepID=UPI002FE0EE79